MLTELRRYNSIGNIDGILFLISIIAEKDKISRNEIQNRCSLESNIYVNCPGAVAFFEYLNLVDTTSDYVVPSQTLNSFARKNNSYIIDQLVYMSIARLVEEGIFDNNATGFDVNNGHLTIKKSSFPLSYAVVRNFLILAGAFEKEDRGAICVSSMYEPNLTEQLRDRRTRFTLEQLLKQQEEQNKRGLEAEEFVLEIEKCRLPQISHNIKRISDVDVSAGYDIVSYESLDSENYDRFIEVKCYIGSPHFFWSENESDVARIKADKYYLCLVNYDMMGKPSYMPEYIKNPYSIFFDKNEWLVNTASYRIQKI